MAELTPLAWLAPGGEPVATGRRDLAAAAARVREPLAVVLEPAARRLGVAFGGALEPAPSPARLPVLGLLPALYPEWLGDRAFAEAHGLRFPYVAGSMANAISGTRLVAAVARAGGLAFFGAAGCDPDQVERAVDELARELGPDAPGWGSNLIHSPHEPDLERALVELYLRRGVRRVEASAFMDLTPPVVRYSASGLRRGPDGLVQRANHLLAKVSRPEVARRFLEPAPPALLATLVAAGQVTAEEARLAAAVPLAGDVTVEADSAGHTDNQALTALVPVIQALRDRVAAEHGLERPARVGAAGGLGCPTAVAAAFGLGAAYVLTGTVNQACVESGLSDAGRELLAQVGVGDVMMAPSADMFELGVSVQVARRGTMFGVRARALYELYRRHADLDHLSAGERERLEGELLRCPLDEAWASTRAYWLGRDPAQVERAERDPHHRMALVFRSYLGQASRWAIEGRADRRADFQVWCGPAMAAFNAWTAGSFLEDPARRSVTQVALNLLEGAAVATRAAQLRTFGLPVPAEAFAFRPQPLELAR